MTKEQGRQAQNSNCLELLKLHISDTFIVLCYLLVMWIFRTLRSNQCVRNYSVQNSWNAGHVLFKHKEVSKNVYFIQEKYFEFSWNLANIFFIKVNLSRTRSRDMTCPHVISAHDRGVTVTSWWTRGSASTASPATWAGRG